MKNFKWQAIVTLLLVLAGGLCFAQDSSITVHFKKEIGNGVTIEGDAQAAVPKTKIIYLKGETVFLPSKPDTIRIKADCPTCPKCEASQPIKIEKYFGEFTGGFDDWWKWCFRNGYTAVLDRSVTVYNTISIDSNFTMISYNGSNIYSEAYNLFTLGKGDHLFRGFNVFQKPGCNTAFYTVTKNNLVYNNTIQRVNVTGGRQAYTSQLGGLYDAKADTVIKWAGVTFEDCVFRTTFNCIGVFSQDGPCKFLHMKNVDMYCDTSDNIYSHPNVSHLLNNVKSYKTGTTISGGASKGLALHMFSGGAGDIVNGVMRGVPSNARYVILNKCYTIITDSIRGGAWQIAEPITGFATVDSSDLSIYEIPRPKMIARKTNIQSGPFRGECFNCSGSPRPLDGSVFTGGKYGGVGLGEGGTITFKNALVDEMWGPNKVSIVPLVLILDSTKVSRASFELIQNYKVILDNGSPKPGARYSRVIPDSAIIDIKQ